MPAPVLNHVMEMHVQNEMRLIGLLETEAKAHADTLSLLKALKSGEVEMNRVVLTDDGWRVTPAKD